MSQIPARLLIASLVLLLLPPVAGAAEPNPAPPTEVRRFLELLDDPAVRAWLQANRPPAQGAGEPPASDQSEASPASFISDRLARMHAHLMGLAAALPRIPAEARSSVARAVDEVQSRSLYEILVMVAAFVGLGFAFEGAFRRLCIGPLRAPIARPLDSIARKRRAYALRMALGVGRVLSFGLGSFGAFLLFDWPPLLQETALTVLLALLATRLAVILTEFLLAPSHGGSAGDAAGYRLIPTDDGAASFWSRRILAFTGYFAAGYAVIGLMRIHGLSREVTQLAAYVLGLGLLAIAIAIEATWRRPVADANTNNRRGADLIITVYLALLWMVWVTGALGLFWIGVYAGFLAKAVKIVGTIARSIIGRDAGSAPDVPSVGAIIVERGARAVLLILAVLWLAYVLRINADLLQYQDSVAMRLGRGLAAAVAILLIADLVWQLVRAAIAQGLAKSRIAEGLTDAEISRRTRLQTLLPVLRNILLGIVGVTALLMALSALGFEIGPLIAGAGVVGVAIGFGSQTLVKDIISGVFYMLDDAFRVGEYIQSGNYKGTVESFSLRSVKLRHHRGPVYTVPFGSLGAVQNMSRDWVIDKFLVRVVYDTELAKVKKIIKVIGEELKADPEFSPHILETLKMQGVEQFGEFALELRFKMMTKPGEQFAIRRRAFAMIKQAFADHGIHFALPTVQVAEAVGEAGRSAAAKEVLDMIKKPDAAE